MRLSVSQFTTANKEAQCTTKWLSISHRTLWFSKPKPTVYHSVAQYSTVLSVALRTTECLKIHCEDLGSFGNYTEAATDKQHNNSLAHSRKHVFIFFDMRSTATHQGQNK